MTNSWSIGKKRDRLQLDHMKKMMMSVFLWYIKFLAKLQLKKNNPLIIGVTGSAGKTSALNSIEAVLKDISDKKIVEELSITDQLTKLYNRKQFDNKFKNLFEEAIYNSTSLCFIIADADHFKYVNDNYGHKKGDEVLIEISKILSDNTRDDDLCARWGGEEFVIILPGTNIVGAFQFAEKLRKKGVLFIKDE